MTRLLALLTLAAVSLAAQAPDTVQVVLPHAAPVALSHGQKLVVEAKGNITTGYAWSAKSVPDCLVAVGEPAYVQDPSDDRRVGAGGRFLLTFEARKAGEGQLVLAYARPWEKDAAPIQTATLRVTVK